MHNDLILPVYQDVFHGARTKDERLYIGDVSLIKYTPKHINQWATEIISHINVKLVSVPFYVNII